MYFFFFFFFQAEDGIRDLIVTGVQTCALPICSACTTVAAPMWTGPTRTPIAQLTRRAAQPAAAHPQRRLGTPASTVGGAGAALTLTPSITRPAFPAAGRATRPRA